MAGLGTVKVDVTLNANMDAPEFDGLDGDIPIEVPQVTTGGPSTAAKIARSASEAQH